MGSVCMICGKECHEDGKRYHPSCSRKMFGTDIPPTIPFGIKELKDLAGQIIAEKTTITGVQKKLSLTINRESQENKLTFVGLWGDYILKPPVEQYAELPENEFTTMCLADTFGLKTVFHALLPLSSGEAAYVTKRIDRNAKGKIHMEDMAQILERMTEDKYRGSAEQIGKAVLKHCENRMLDALRFYELILFSYLMGNADMHLKNFSLLYGTGGIGLAPAYDLVNTRLVIPEKDDPDESAVSINGKRRKLKQKDFTDLAESLGLKEKQISNTHQRFFKKREDAEQMIERSPLSEESKAAYVTLFRNRLRMIE